MKRKSLHAHCFGRVQHYCNISVKAAFGRTRRYEIFPTLYTRTKESLIKLKGPGLQSLTGTRTSLHIIEVIVFRVLLFPLTLRSSAPLLRVCFRFLLGLLRRIRISTYDRIRYVICFLYLYLFPRYTHWPKSNLARPAQLHFRFAYFLRYLDCFFSCFFFCSETSRQMASRWRESVTERQPDAPPKA